MPPLASVLTNTDWPMSGNRDCTNRVSSEEERGQRHQNRSVIINEELSLMCAILKTYHVARGGQNFCGKGLSNIFIIKLLLLVVHYINNLYRHLCIVR